MINFAALVTWLTAAMISWVPVARHLEANPANTRGAIEAHYAEIAVATATFVLEDGFVPYFRDHGIERSALLLVAIPSGESHYNPIIDRGGSVKKGDNDGGAAVGPWQVHWRGNAWKYSRDDIAQDRAKGLKIADAHVRWSINACRHKDWQTWLTGYATGKATCEPNKKTALYVYREESWWKTHPFEQAIGVD